MKIYYLFETYLHNSHIWKQKKTVLLLRALYFEISEQTRLLAISTYWIKDSQLLIEDRGDSLLFLKNGTYNRSKHFFILLEIFIQEHIKLLIADSIRFT